MCEIHFGWCFFFSQLLCKLMRRRSQTKGDAKRIFENEDVFSKISGLAQNPNVRKVNSTTAIMGRYNTDGLGKKYGDFKEQIDFVSNNGFNLPIAQPEHYHTQYRIVKGKRAVKRDVYCQNIADMNQNPNFKDECKKQCNIALSDQHHVAMDIQDSNITDFDMIDYSFRKINPEHLEFNFRKQHLSIETRSVTDTNIIQSARLQCDLLSLAGIDKVGYINVNIPYHDYMEEKILDSVINLAKDLWLGPDVSPRKFSLANTPYINCVILMIDDPSEKVFCKLFEPGEDGMQYKTYERLSQDEDSEEYWERLETSYVTLNELLQEMKRVLTTLNGNSIWMQMLAMQEMF